MSRRFSESMRTSVKLMFASRRLRTALLLMGAVTWSQAVAAENQSGPPQVEDLKVTILSTMLADSRGLGEWGFSALVEADGQKILYDTGYRPGTVQRNAEELGVDLSGVEHVILSHNHGDHTGGLLTLRKALQAKNPRALSQVHVGAGLFRPRRFPERLAEIGFEFPPMSAVRSEYEGTGGSVKIHPEPAQLLPGVWITGPVPRRHPEQNWSPGVQVEMDGSWVPDEVQEDSALIINTRKGLVVITGCGHAGVINILDYAREIAASSRIHAVIGGLHLLAASDETLDWTAENMKRNGLQSVTGAHCTGLHALYRLRDRLGLAREHATVGAVGASFSLESGIDPLRVAR